MAEIVHRTFDEFFIVLGFYANTLVSLLLEQLDFVSNPMN